MTPRRDINFVSIQKFLISGCLSGHPAERLRMSSRKADYLSGKTNNYTMKGAEILPSAIEIKDFFQRLKGCAPSPFFIEVKNEW